MKQPTENIDFTITSTDNFKRQSSVEYQKYRNTLQEQSLENSFLPVENPEAFSNVDLPCLKNYIGDGFFVSEDVVELPEQQRLKTECPTSLKRVFKSAMFEQIWRKEFCASSGTREPQETENFCWKTAPDPLDDCDSGRLTSLTMESTTACYEELQDSADVKDCIDKKALVDSIQFFIIDGLTELDSTIPSENLEDYSKKEDPKEDETGSPKKIDDDECNTEDDSAGTSIRIIDKLDNPEDTEDMNKTNEHNRSMKDPYFSNQFVEITFEKGIDDTRKTTRKSKRDRNLEGNVGKSTHTFTPTKRSIIQTTKNKPDLLIKNQKTEITRDGDENWYRDHTPKRLSQPKFQKSARYKTLPEIYAGRRNPVNLTKCKMPLSPKTIASALHGWFFLCIALSLCSTSCALSKTDDIETSNSECGSLLIIKIDVTSFIQYIEAYWTGPEEREFGVLDSIFQTASLLLLVGCYMLLTKLKNTCCDVRIAVKERKLQFLMDLDLHIEAVFCRCQAILAEEQTGETQLPQGFLKSTGLPFLSPKWTLARVLQQEQRTESYERRLNLFFVMV